MNYFRKLASGKRNRYKQDHYDLDITYITSRILAMSFPAQGIEKLYRNPIDKVARFLGEKHGDNYLVFNFSDRKYNYAKFDNRVEEYEWKDHHAPKIVVLFAACKRMYEFLEEDDRNVIVVHCNAGKGRTGTSIACFLMFWGLSRNSTDAINYYGWKRFSTGKGVSQPCQLRYIHYFEAALKREVLWSVPKILECIIIRTIPKINQNGCKPYVDIWNGDYQLIHSTKNSINLKKYKAGPRDSEEFNVIKIYPEKKNLVISGDAHFFIRHKRSFNNTNICRFSVNTGFIDNELVIPRDQISPDSVSVSKKFHDKFQITLILRDYWDSWTSRTLLKDVWERCKLRMSKTIKEWNEVYDILSDHTPPPTENIGKHLWFNSRKNWELWNSEESSNNDSEAEWPHIDYDFITNKEMAVNVEKYNLIKDENNLNPIKEDVNEDKEMNSNVTYFGDYKMTTIKSDEDYFKYIPSKDERNTMLPKGAKLEEDKENAEDYFRSVNEFHSK